MNLTIEKVKEILKGQEESGSMQFLMAQDIIELHDEIFGLNDRIEDLESDIDALEGEIDDWEKCGYEK